MAQARSAIADLVGGVPEGVVLGPNMTTLTFRIADTLSRGWGPGDEVVVTSLDHDANIRPWRLAAERAGATVRVIHTVDIYARVLNLGDREYEEALGFPALRRSAIRSRSPPH